MLAEHVLETLLGLFVGVGDVTKATNARVAVYTCPFDAMATETKGTVLIKTAQELMSFSKGEEDLIEQVSSTRESVASLGMASPGPVLHYFWCISVASEGSCWSWLYSYGEWR